MTTISTLRFTYFTEKYDETFEFYLHKLELELGHSWDRNEYDKGAVFKLGQGLIEILRPHKNIEKRYLGLDYRPPQGVFTGIKVSNIDDLYEQYQTKGIPFRQEIIDQPWGHRSFYVEEPNGLILGFYQEQF